jgi:exodeoxyribonuclease V alpha subunit
MLENEVPIFDHALKNNDFWFINATNEEDIIKKLLLKIQGVSQRFHFDIKNDIQVLTPVKKGKLGQHNLNHELQNLINSSREEIQYYSQGDIQRYRKNDKIIQTINNYDHDIFNGENGIISEISKGEVAINFEGQTIYYKQFELEQISLAYALTVHKSQGSEYPCVFIPIHPNISYHLYKDILYTALTRGKNHVIFIGCYETFKKCILRKRSAKRFSTLQYQLLKSI